MAIDSQRNSRAHRTSAAESASAGTMQEVRSEPAKAPPDAWLAPVLVNSGLLTPDQARQLLAPGTSAVWAAAVTHGWTSDESIAAAVSRMYRLPLADVTTSDSRTTTLVPESLARKHRVVPLSATDRTIQIASADPRDLDLEQTLRFVTGREVAFQVATPPRHREPAGGALSPRAGDRAVARGPRASGHRSGGPGGTTGRRR